MARMRDRDVNWSPEAEEQLLRRLGEFNLLKSVGTTPHRDKYTQWAAELSEHFIVPLTWDKVKQKASRLKKMFDAEFLLRTATGLGWDSIKKKPTCTDEYWQQFISIHPEVERARRKPLLDYDLYYCAFANTRANGAFEYGQDDAPPQHRSGSPIERGTTSFNDGDDVPLTDRRNGMHRESRGQHTHSPSRVVRRRSSRSSRRASPSYMELVVDLLINLIETSSRSRGINASANMSVQIENVQDQCMDLLATLDISQEQYLFMFNFMTMEPRWQRPFLHMPEHHRLVWIQQTMEQCTTQQVALPPPQ
ncbi:uncharacterized protein LOC21411252 [Morus notabilis]|uniref:uncharacterized protein LOC21411252 n=1 Tax=Morus notabilis TaxID=981085 RepID=UPI000CED7739|nr:uncharacterized protein LOC21411252 [Morus notabilis]